MLAAFLAVCSDPRANKLEDLDNCSRGRNGDRPLTAMGPMGNACVPQAVTVVAVERHSSAAASEIEFHGEDARRTGKATL